ncbi:MAG: aminotransferase class I/II-fold pyridoxal phosphate-dependent enzyme [Bacillota bacterium]
MKSIESKIDFEKNYSEFDEAWQKLRYLKEAEIYYYFCEVDALEGAWVHTEGKRKLMFSTFNYLGLLGDKGINEAAKRAVDKYGTGTHGSRILGGTLTVHAKLEKKIAEFTGREDAIAFSTGYTTNLATIKTIAGDRGWIFSDELNHASIIDGCIISKSNVSIFKHNDMADLERVLRQAPVDCRKLVVADAVFSMDGDIFNLPEAVELCRRYNALLMVDEAHSVGAIGETCRGIEEYFGLHGSIDIKMGTMSKAIPAIGGYIASSGKIINYLRHYARGFIFTAALPPAMAAAAHKAFEIIEAEGAGLQKKIKYNVRYFTDGLRNSGFDTGVSETPIIPVILGDDITAMRMTRICQENNVFVLPVLTPAVPPGTARIRLNVTAGHTVDDLDFALEVLTAAGRELGII